MTAKRTALQISLFIHVGLFITALGLSVIFKQATTSQLKNQMPFEVIENPQVAPVALQITPPVVKEERPKAQQEPRKVFGVSRKAITSSENSGEAVQVKLGNTVAKEMDQLKLEASDADQIPIPAEDYLVTSQVALIKDIKIAYPPEAKQANIEGAVVMDLIIDQEGRVRSVSLIRGPGYGLNEAALEAVKQFLFRPARIQDKPVAVKIRYSYRFVLENK